ncbi:M15 family metallopeptidase [Sporosarcina sp. P33]|uniref:M15 family metallopeptidase n=1 Tax=Sporosarcina sp. P33 TaxID=1930764 RepID=UPI0009BEB212|nr:M15 family metallopeptidase [Sporosarcina sp. P33]ARD47554.1 hypothetical protein SporoP33_04425 [Sporosarcina sp. P33]
MRASVFQLISKSERAMGAVHPRLKALAIELIKRAYHEGINIRITAGHRTNAEQQRLYNQGRFGNPGIIVTKAKPGQSIHNFGLAIDYVLVNEDDTDVSWVVNKQWRRVGAIGKQLGFQWGGDWTSFRDYPHLDLQRGMSLADLRAGKLPSLPSVPSRPYLGQGDTGAEVKSMQSALVKAGYTTDVDGIFGQGTEDALRTFQAANGLMVDGLYGASSKRLLGSPDMVAAVDIKGDDELEFSSGSLRKELEFSLSSRAHRQMIVDAALAQGYSQVHAERLADGKIKDGDLMALAVGTLIKANK